jgi:hypothetical protein
MLAYKFLAPGRRSVLSGFRWPLDEWVETEDPSLPELRAVYGCRREDLPYWLAEELWVLELADPVRPGERRVFAPRGRLLQPVPAWSALAVSEFTRACEARDRGLGVADPADGWVPCPGAAYIAAHAAGLAAAAAGRGYETGFVRERAWQAAWLVDHLGLAPLSPG